MENRIRELLDNHETSTGEALTQVLNPFLSLTDHEKDFFSWFWYGQRHPSVVKPRLRGFLNAEEAETLREAIEGWDDLPASCRLALFLLLVRLTIAQMDKVVELRSC